MRLRQLTSQLQAHTAAVATQVGACIVSPTRELAKQTFAVLQPFLETLPGVGATLLVGGRWAVCSRAMLPAWQLVKVLVTAIMLL